MLLFYISCSSKGAADYARSMFMFDHLLRYWIRLGLPIHTIFSEESGEIALSVLSHSQPPTKRSELKNAQDYWILTRQRYLLSDKGKTFLDTRNIALLVRHPPPITHPS